MIRIEFRLILRSYQLRCFLTNNSLVIACEFVKLLYFNRETIPLVEVKQDLSMSMLPSVSCAKIPFVRPSFYPQPIMHTSKPLGRCANHPKHFDTLKRHFIDYKNKQIK